MASTVRIDDTKLKRLIADLAEAAQDVVDDTLDETGAFMHQRVHVLTGQTKGSITVDHQEGTVTADYGAVWEEHRGGGHAFMTNSFEESMRRVEDKLTRALTKAMGH